MSGSGLIILGIITLLMVGVGINALFQAIDDAKLSNSSSAVDMAHTGDTMAKPIMMSLAFVSVLVKREVLYFSN